MIELAACKRGDLRKNFYQQKNKNRLRLACCKRGQHSFQQSQELCSYKDTKPMLYCCMRMSHLAAAQWPREQSAPWPDKLCCQDNYAYNSTFAIQCGFEMLQWAVRAGCPCSNDWPYGTCNELSLW
jgi:hypothetical protein